MFDARLRDLAYEHLAGRLEGDSAHAPPASGSIQIKVDPSDAYEHQPDDEQPLVWQQQAGRKHERTV